MSSFRKLIERAKLGDSYWVEKAILEFTSDIHMEMQRQGKTKADLARAIGTSPAYITKIFSGNANFTIQSMVKVSRSLGCRLHIKAIHETKELSFSHFPKKFKGNTALPCDIYLNEKVNYASSSIAA